MNGYRLLLRLAPRRLRDRHAAEMEAMFRERLADASERGALAVAAAWCRAAADIRTTHSVAAVRDVVATRIAELRARLLSPAGAGAPPPPRG